MEGRTPRHKGSFGWVIATESKIVWTGGGIVRGHPIHSFRAEAYGRLAGLSMLRRLREHYKWQDKTAVTIKTYTDNQSVLKREAAYEAKEYHTPSFYLQA